MSNTLRTNLLTHSLAYLLRALLLCAAFAAGLARAVTLVEVQVYENSQVFPGEVRFFMTARETDKAFLAQYPQMGWRRLTSFSAYAPVDAPADARPVCRFFLPTLATHFYTALVDECARFKADPLFVFEGNDFAALPVGVNGCATGASPIFRTYNNGSSRSVSGNHFYSTNPGLADDLVASAGWNKEGAVFCVPDASETDKKVVVAGRAGIYASTASSVATGSGAVLGPAVVQVISTDGTTERAWPDPLGGETDWQANSAFDAARGRVYLVRAQQLVDNGIFGAPHDAPVRDTMNVMELDVASGAARYLNVAGNFTDAIFDPKRNELLLAGASADNNRLVWIDTASGSILREASTGTESRRALLHRTGSASCPFIVENQMPWNNFDFTYYLLTTSSHCISADGLRLSRFVAASASLSPMCIGNGIVYQRGSATLRRWDIDNNVELSPLVLAGGGLPGEDLVATRCLVEDDAVVVFLSTKPPDVARKMELYINRFIGDKRVAMVPMPSSVANVSWEGFCFLNQSAAVSSLLGGVSQYWAAFDADPLTANGYPALRRFSRSQPQVFGDIKTISSAARLHRW